MFWSSPTVIIFITLIRKINIFIGYDRSSLRSPNTTFHITSTRTSTILISEFIQKKLKANFANRNRTFWSSWVAMFTCQPVGFHQEAAQTQLGYFLVSWQRQRYHSGSKNPFISNPHLKSRSSDHTCQGWGSPACRLQGKGEVHWCPCAGSNKLPATTTTTTSSTKQA